MNPGPRSPAAPDHAPGTGVLSDALGAEARDLYQRAGAAARSGDHATARALLAALARQPGLTPDALRVVRGARAELGPDPVAVVIGVAALLVTLVVSYGVIARGAGGNPKALSRAGWSMLRTKIVMYMLAGFFGVLSGLALLGLTTSGDAHVADRYTLYSIAGVILGGGEFIGGRVSPLGAVVGALTLALAGSFLIFLKISPDWQIGAQGAILVVVLALRALVTYGEQKR